jgi:hypothetical protein
LPIDSDVNITNTKKTKYNKDDTYLSAYEIDIAITYEKDLDYDGNVKVTIVKDENKLYVVSLSANE